MATGDCHDQYFGSRVVVKEERVLICGWPTDTLEIDHRAQCGQKSDEVSSNSDKHGALNKTHKLILFIPGNPGVIHWYIESLIQIVERLGRGFAVRGVSYAGHGVGEDVVGTNDDHKQSFHNENMDNNINGKCDSVRLKDMTIPWTMDGQIKHKMKWIKRVLEDGKRQSMNHPRLIFISHSIGAHFVQCILLRRPDILSKTEHVVHLMPFIRFDPPPLKKIFLSLSAHSYKYTIPTMTTLTRALSASLPRNWIDLYLHKVVGLDCTKGRQLALDIFTNPNMVRNHLVLGMQELRDIPEFPNDVALRLIGEISPCSLLFCGGPDQWAPEFHMRDLRSMQSRSDIPISVHTELMEDLLHDFVVHPEQINRVVSFCVDRIKKGREADQPKIRSRL